MFKKCYVAIVSDENGLPIGSIMCEIIFYRNAKYAYDQMVERLASHQHVVEFKRIK